MYIDRIDRTFAAEDLTGLDTGLRRLSPELQAGDEPPLFFAWVEVKVVGPEPVMQA